MHQYIPTGDGGSYRLLFFHSVQPDSIMIDEPDKTKFLEWLNNVLTRKEIELQARAKLLNGVFSKVRQLDQEDVDAFNFYEIGMEVEYLDEYFDHIHFDRLLFHDVFFDSDEVP